MHNGVMFRIDPDLRDYFEEIQKQRHNAGVDKHKKSLTDISRVAWKVLSLNKNVDRMLKSRVPT